MAQLPGDAVSPSGTQGYISPKADRPIAGYTGGIAQRAGVALGEGVGRLGMTGVEAAMTIQDTKDRLASAAAEQDFLSKKLDLDQQFATDKDYQTAPQRYRAALQQALIQSGAGITGGVQRADYQNRMARWVEYGTNSMLRESTAKWKDQGRGNTLEALDSAVNDAIRAPDAATQNAIFGAVNDRLSAARDSGWITETERQKWAKAVPQAYATKRAEMLRDTNPAAAATALQHSDTADDGSPIYTKTGDWRDYLDPAKRAQIYRESVQRSEEGNTVFRGSVEDRYRNNFSALYATGQASQPLTADEIRQAYPAAKYGDRAEHMIRQLAGAAKVGTATRDMALTSPVEDEAKVAAFEPKLGAPDYGDQMDRQKAVIQAYNEKYQALAKDPAGYVLQASPQIAAMNQAALKDPTKMGAYVAAVNAAYDKLGVPPANRTVFPAGQAQSLAKAITDDPETAPAKLRAMQQQYGSAWDDVWHTLSTAGKLPPAFQSVGTLDNERDASLLARALAEQGKTGKSWGDILGSKPESDIKTAVRSDPTVQSLLSSLSRSGMSATQVDGILGSIDTLAYAKSFYDKDPRAAQNAIDSFTGKYQFMSQGGARVPSDKYPSVAANANLLLSRLTGEHVAIPEVYGKPGMPKADEYTDLVKSSPSWITSPKADALWLMDPYGRLVRDKAGSPVAVPFAAPMPTFAEQPSTEAMRP